MASEIQRTRIRTDLQVSATMLSNDAIDDLYLRATEGSIAEGLITEAWVRILAIDQLLAGAAKTGDVRVNEVEFKRSPIFGNLLKLRALWVSNYDTLVADTDDATVVDFGSLARPFHLREYPGDWFGWP